MSNHRRSCNCCGCNPDPISSVNVTLVADGFSCGCVKRISGGNNDHIQLGSTSVDATYNVAFSSENSTFKTFFSFFTVTSATLTTYASSVGCTGSSSTANGTSLAVYVQLRKTSCRFERVYAGIGPFPDGQGGSYYPFVFTHGASGVDTYTFGETIPTATYCGDTSIPVVETPNMNTQSTAIVEIA